MKLELMCKAENVGKVSRRDFAIYVAEGRDGATTVASTMMCCAYAGIQVFATGGIGGVHRHGEVTMDVSADLQELAHTNVAVVCAGAKQILDIGRTLEYLETMGSARYRQRAQVISPHSIAARAAMAWTMPPRMKLTLPSLSIPRGIGPEGRHADRQPHTTRICHGL